MKTPEISVIVPIYNAEKYLIDCIDSIARQSFSDMEIICVNDGSKDNSLKILECCQKKDSRIVIVNKENGGLSSARNAGMKAAKGRYISFIDADDYAADDMLEKLYLNITALNTDISMCAVCLFDDSTKISNYNDAYFNLSAFPESFDNRVFSYEDTADFLMDIPVTAWNKLYRRSFIEECSAEFPEGKIFEDGPFFFKIYFKTKRVSIVREPLYFYRINRAGSIIKKGGEKFLDIIDVVNLMFNELKEADIFERAKYSFFRHKAADIIYRSESVPLRLKKKFARKLKNESCLFDEKYFDFSFINKEMPVLYKGLLSLKNEAGIFEYLKHRFTVRFMYKVMQVLYTEQNMYYFKFWSLKFKIKKHAGLCDIWYENDRIYAVLFKKIKLSFKFEYSKLEQK